MLHLWLLLSSASAVPIAPPPANATCPCSDAALCRPTYRPHGDFAREREVFGFNTKGGGDYKHYDWDIVSTLAWGDDKGMICEAHRHGARVVMGAGSFKLPIQPSDRTAWVAAQVARARAGHFDGITFDYEDPIGVGEAEKMTTYVALVDETRAAFHAQIPGSQVSVCVAWSPDDIDGRAYDYQGLCSLSGRLYE